MQEKNRVKQSVFHVFTVLTVANKELFVAVKNIITNYRAIRTIIFKKRKAVPYEGIMCETQTVS